MQKNISFARDNKLLHFIPMNGNLSEWDTVVRETNVTKVWLVDINIKANKLVNKLGPICIFHRFSAKKNSHVLAIVKFFTGAEFLYELWTEEAEISLH